MQYIDANLNEHPIKSISYKTILKILLTQKKKLQNRPSFLAKSEKSVDSNKLDSKMCRLNKV